MKLTRNATNLENATVDKTVPAPIKSVLSVNVVLTANAQRLANVKPEIVRDVRLTTVANKLAND